MARNSVDDKYEGCAKSMANLVKDKVFDRKPSDGTLFHFAWKEATQSCDNPGYNLTLNHCIALSMYTGVDIHREFNAAVREGRSMYRSQTYTWSTLHFYLTEALQILQGQPHCRQTYRGTPLSFNTDVKNKEIRLGTFASSSLHRKIAMQFGTKSCFEINTCYGADIAWYSQFKDEAEVLIPPYETFVVTDVLHKTSHADLWCETVYVLKSSGTRSFLNCAVAQILRPTPTPSGNSGNVTLIVSLCIGALIFFCLCWIFKRYQIRISTRGGGTWHCTMVQT